MKDFYFNIIHWAAWAPGLENKDDWYDWVQNKKQPSKDFFLTPDINFIPAANRRRLSQLTKISLKTANDCVKSHKNVESVFASRYGELSQTIKLLESISLNEELSPAGFSASVHNTAAGIHSIINKNIKSYTALSGGEKTFDALFIEGLGRLQNQDKILLTIGEEFVKDYHEIMPFSLSFLIGKTEGKKIKVTVMEKQSSPSQNSALEFLKWFLSDNKENFFSGLNSFKKADA